MQSGVCVGVPGGSISCGSVGFLRVHGGVLGRNLGFYLGVEVFVRLGDCVSILRRGRLLLRHPCVQSGVRVRIAAGFLGCDLTGKEGGDVEVGLAHHTGVPIPERIVGVVGYEVEQEVGLHGLLDHAATVLPQACNRLDQITTVIGV